MAQSCMRPLRERRGQGNGRRGKKRRVGMGWGGGRNTEDK